MKANVKKAFDTLKMLGCPVKEWDGDDRGHFWIDAEEENAELWLDYWNTDLAFGSDKLNQILDDNGLYWEWYNSAYGCVYDN
jgi:hypothetical protein